MTLAVAASPALAAPVPSFTVSPDPPVSGVQATYTSTSTSEGQGITKVEWDFDNDGTFEVSTEAPFTTPHMYANAGTKTFKMRVTDDALGVTTADQTVTVATRAPQADFAFNPDSPQVQDDVLFASDASDPDGDALDYLWDFGDGSPTSTAHHPVHRYATAGTKTVTLTVTDPYGASKTVTHQVVVRGILVPGNRSPMMSFAFSPRTPKVGDAVEFVSSSFDPDGDLRVQAWDLDGDGEFDDARGADVLYTYTSAGTKNVRLQGTDNAGTSAIVARAVTVTAAPKPPPGFLRPEPRVRLNGLIYGNGIRIKILSVRAPRGALVTVRCKGKGCPAKQRRKKITKSTVRFTNFERFLPSGVRIEIFVTKGGKVGDYTRYTIRGGKSPQRVDRCVAGSKLRPVSCR